jgi:hypothetical protein
MTSDSVRLDVQRFCPLCPRGLNREALRVVHVLPTPSVGEGWPPSWVRFSGVCLLPRLCLTGYLMEACKTALPPPYKG